VKWEDGGFGERADALTEIKKFSFVQEEKGGHPKGGVGPFFPRV